MKTSLRILVLVSSLLLPAAARAQIVQPSVPGDVHVTDDFVPFLMYHAVGTQGALAANYARMIAGRDGSLREFNPYLGVAAFPSLHVGAHWLFALWARRHARPMFVPFAVATALTFVASVATGWHYAVDGYAGLLLAWLVVTVADRLEPAPRDEKGPRPRAADGGPEGARGVPEPTKTP